MSLLDAIDHLAVNSGIGFEINIPETDEQFRQLRAETRLSEEESKLLASYQVLQDTYRKSGELGVDFEIDEEAYREMVAMPGVIEGDKTRLVREVDNKGSVTYHLLISPFIRMFRLDREADVSLLTFDVLGGTMIGGKEIRFQFQIVTPELRFDPTTYTDLYARNIRQVSLIPGDSVAERMQTFTDA